MYVYVRSLTICFQDRDKKGYLDDLKREKDKFEQKEKVVEKLEREVARLTENSRDIDRQRQELEDKYLKEFEQQKQEAEEIKQEQERRVAHLQEMIREHGLEENVTLHGTVILKRN